MLGSGGLHRFPGPQQLNKSLTDRQSRCHGVKVTVTVQYRNLGRERAFQSFTGHSKLDGTIVVIEFSGYFHHLLSIRGSVVGQVHKQLVAEGALPTKYGVPQRVCGGQAAKGM